MEPSSEVPPIPPLLLRVVLSTVVEFPETAKAVKVTPLTVVVGTPGAPKLKARSKVPAVLTSVSPEMVVGAPQVIVAARTAAGVISRAAPKMNSARPKMR